ncbi:MAG: hypothetical protein JW940_39390 [Polyangiaceae bacterium]|nr:hypothetical protein [Polyangiaceae bacterium]
MASTPHWKLRRLAPRAKRVQARRAAEFPAIAAFGPTLLPKADAYIAAFDASMKYAADWRKEMGEGKDAIAGLIGELRAWLPLVARDVPGFDASTYADKPTVPDDALEDAERFAEVIEEHRDATGLGLPYAQQALGRLVPLTASADKESQEAEAADVTYQRLLREVREAGARLDQELVLFRRTLAAVVGRNDKDFQKLRAAKAQQPDEDDDAGAPAAPAPVEPAPPGVTEPSGKAS